MAVYKLFPEKDATIFSYYPATNTGMDEILEVSTFESPIEGTRESSRSLIKFSTSEIVNTIASKVSGSNYKAYLKLYLANASEIPANYTILCQPIFSGWDVGTGRLSNVPATTDGVSWDNRTLGWIWSNGGGDYYGTPISSQLFTNNDEKDIEMDVTSIVAAFYAYETNPFAPVRIQNEGFILKHPDWIEFSTGSAPFELKYFSSDTHTIYPPCLEIRWDDSTFVTGGLTIANNSKVVVSLKNNKKEFQQDSIHKFRLGVRDQYPPRTFNSNQLYVTNTKLLPSSSYWAIKDLDTEEWIVDFDTNYTKISADSTSNFFTIHMNGLQPERFYKILIKSVIDGSTVVFDEDYIFKVVR